jgi:hypothetical protein
MLDFEGKKSSLLFADTMIKTIEEKQRVIFKAVESS